MNLHHQKLIKNNENEHKWMKLNENELTWVWINENQWKWIQKPNDNECKSIQMNSN